jgi:hypothetical protein
VACKYDNIHVLSLKYYSLLVIIGVYANKNKCLLKKIAIILNKLLMCILLFEYNSKSIEI